MKLSDDQPLILRELDAIMRKYREGESHENLAPKPSVPDVPQNVVSIEDARRMKQQKPT